MKAPVPPELSAIRKLLPYLGISLLLAALDLSTKYIVAQTLKGQPPWPRGWNFVYLHYVENYHMAFSLTILKMPVVNALALAAIIFILYYLWRYKDQAVIPSVGLAFILGGALGNIPERIITGFVIDWISFEWPDWLLFTRWPSFNLADASVDCGIVIYLIYVLYLEKRRKTPEIHSEPAA